jgi:hypothetical protein
MLLQDSNDAEALRRFIAEFPDSLRRNDADARLAAVLVAWTAWRLVRDSNDPEQLRRFIEEFPDSVERPAAEQKIASLPAKPSPSTTVASPDPRELTRSLQLELQRVGCFKGTVNGQFDEDTKVAWRRFIKLTSISMSDDVSTDEVKAVRGVIKRVCPLWSVRAAIMSKAKPASPMRPRRRMRLNRGRLQRLRHQLGGRSQLKDQLRVRLYPSALELVEVMAGLAAGEKLPLIVVACRRF